MLRAVADQLEGTSMSAWRKTDEPVSVVISAWRRVHSTWSYGETPLVVLRRWNLRPLLSFFSVSAESLGVILSLFFLSLFSSIIGSCPEMFFSSVAI